MSFPEIVELLPHRPPMIWLDEVVAHEQDLVRCALALRKEHVFLEQGQVEAVVSIEWMAQTVGVLVGLYDRRRSLSPRPGYLIAIPEAEFFVEQFQLGDLLSLQARRVWGDETLGSFECQVERAGSIAARAQLSVYRRALPGGRAP